MTLPLKYDHRLQEIGYRKEFKMDVQQDYPVLAIEIIDKNTRRHFVDGFHGLFGVDNGELAGMGIWIVQELFRALHAEVITKEADAWLRLYFNSREYIDMPWPGMPTDNPKLPLDMTEMPWEWIWKENHSEFRMTMEKRKLMQRIEITWVPWFRKTLFARV